VDAGTLRGDLMEPATQMLDIYAADTSRARSATRQPAARAGARGAEPGRGAVGAIRAASSPQPPVCLDPFRDTSRVNLFLPFFQRSPYAGSRRGEDEKFSIRALAGEWRH
jgi:hypothetical protein